MHSSNSTSTICSKTFAHRSACAPLWRRASNDYLWTTDALSVYDNLHPYFPTVLRFFQVLLRVIRPYTRIRLSFIATELNIPLNEVEDLLVSLILDGHIDGHVDQVRSVTLIVGYADIAL